MKNVKFAARWLGVFHVIQTLSPWRKWPMTRGPWLRIWRSVTLERSTLCTLPRWKPGGTWVKKRNWYIFKCFSDKLYDVSFICSFSLEKVTSYVHVGTNSQNKNTIAVCIHITKKVLIRCGTLKKQFDSERKVVNADHHTESSPCTHRCLKLYLLRTRVTSA